MAIDPGKLDRRIEIYAPVIVDDGLNQRIEYSVLTKKVWAEIQYLSDRERFAAGAVNVDAELRFLIRKTTINHDWQVGHEAKRYSVVSIKPSSKDRSYLEITGALVR